MKIDTKQPDENPGPEGSDELFLTETKTVRLFEKPNELKLTCGKTFGPVDVAYECYGQLDEEKSNAVFICHSLTHDAHAAGRHAPDDPKPGWWDIMIGPGKPIDTNRYFVICANILGGCRGTTGPSSINPDTDKPYGLGFPIITIEDMVSVHVALCRHLGLKKLLSAVGGSLGGMQVLNWAVRYPEMLQSAIPIATVPRLSAQGIAFDAVGRNAILSDQHFHNGDYQDQPDKPDRGLAIARMVGHITYLSEASMHEKFGRSLRHADSYRYDFDSEFSVETYLDYQGRKFVERFDANSYLYITKAADYFDLADCCGSLEKAFQRTKARFLAVSFTSDWLFPPTRMRNFVGKLIRSGRDVTYSNIDSPYGHDAFLLESGRLGQLISGFLDQTYEPRVESPEPRVESSESHEPAVASIFSGKRVDYETIANLIDSGTKVLDLGCGHGELLKRLEANKNVHAAGVEVDEDQVSHCVRRGVNVIHADVDEELTEFADDSFDFVVLSQTLQVIRKPELVLNEMLRVGRKGIVSFPNFGYWRARLHLLFKGHVPVIESLPYEWFKTPNIRMLTLADFENLVKRIGAKITRRIPLVSTSVLPVRFWPNLRAEEAIYVIAGS